MLSNQDKTKILDSAYRTTKIVTPHDLTSLCSTRIIQSVATVRMPRQSWPVTKLVGDVAPKRLIDIALRIHWHQRLALFVGCNALPSFVSQGPEAPNSVHRLISITYRRLRRLLCLRGLMPLLTLLTGSRK